MNERKRLASLLLIVTFVLALIPLLGGCDALLEGNREIRPLAEGYIDALMANDFAAAQELCPEFDSIEHKKYFDIFGASFEGASSYEINQIGWNTNITNGITYKKATYEITTDNGKTLYFEFTTQNGISGLSYVNFNDSTEFIESTKYLWIADIAFKAVSVAVALFGIYLIIDCAKRKMPMKALWIILILLTVAPGFTIGGGKLNMTFDFGLIISMSSVTAVAVSSTITAKLWFPIGAIVYWSVRKKYPFKKDLSAEKPATETEAPYVPIPEENTESHESDCTEAERSEQAIPAENDNDSGTTE